MEISAQHQMARIMAEKEMKTEAPVMVDISAELSIVEEAVDAEEELPAVASGKMLVLLRIIPDQIFNFCTKQYNSKSSKLKKRWSFVTKNYLEVKIMWKNFERTGICCNFFICS